MGDWILLIMFVMIGAMLVSHRLKLDHLRFRMENAETRLTKIEPKLPPAMQDEDIALERPIGGLDLDPATHPYREKVLRDGPGSRITLMEPNEEKRSGEET